MKSEDDEQDGEAMPLTNADVAIPANATVAANVLSSSRVADTSGEQDDAIDQRKRPT